VEQDGVETPGVTRGLNAAFVFPPDWTHAPSFLTPAIERLDAALPAVQMLVITADADAAVALAAAANALGRARGLTALAATSSRRAGRALRARPAQIVTGDPAALVGLLQSSALKLDQVRQLVIAWLDDTLEGNEAPLEALFAEAPKDAARTIVTRELSPAIEGLIERYARRARRVVPAAGEEVAAMPVQYVAVHDTLRSIALRRLLDELDPPTAFIFVRDPMSHIEVLATLETLGYAADGPVRIGRAAEADCDALVLYDLPVSRAELRDVAGGRTPRQVIALIQPRQLAALREVAGGAASPLTLPEAIARARTKEEQLRESLRHVLVSGAFTRELLALEPLLTDFDGIEIAAAALRMLEVERMRAAAPKTFAAPKMRRLFITAGESDGIRAGDLVGAVTNIGGLSGGDVGRVELRDRHSLVEVPEAVAEAVAAKITGITIKGRQIVARLDEERPERSGRGGPREDRPRGAPRDREDRPRGGPRDRDDRPRGGPRDRDDRPRPAGRFGASKDDRGGPPRKPRRREDDHR